MSRAAGIPGHLFLVERYLPDFTVEVLVRRQLGGVRPDAPGRAIPSSRQLESIWIPEDETVISTFLAASSDALDASLRAGGLPADRIVRAVRLGPGTRPPTPVSKERHP